MPTLHWIGKDKVIKHHHDVPFRVLNHQYTFPNMQGGDSISENKIIHGDNLEALKALLPYYEGKIKCIYIDPPYNTGNEGWVYNDNVNDPKIKKWLGKVVGKEAEDLTRHDKWLCMMYPRLKLLHKLLAPDGAIFVSIDDNEQANLKLLMDEIFGENNYLGLITRKQSSGSKNDTGNNKIVTTADYIICFGKKNFSFLPFKVQNNKKFTNSDTLGSFSTRALEMQGGGDTLPQRNKMGYSIYYNQLTNDVKLLFDYNLENEQVYEAENKDLINNGYKCYRPRKRGNEFGIWRWGAETFIERFHKNLVHFDSNRVYMKERETDFINKYPEALIEYFLNTQGTNELKDIFSSKVFDFPKPSELIKFICSVATDKDSIILDSFAGSGTTAHAVLNLNKADGGNRKFILVEMEDYAESITAERVKRVINGYGNVEGMGGDFNYYELGESLFDEDRNLNENLPVATLRDYIWYVETKHSLSTQTNEFHQQPYFLDKYQETAYFFIYEKERITTLDYDFLEHVTIQAEQYVMYADNCTLSEAFRREKHIIFKKIPRDISRF